MGPEPIEHPIVRFVYELMRTGSMLSELVADLSAALPSDAYPGEEPSAVITEMLCGTIVTALRSADPRDVQRASELIADAAERTVEHLRLAHDLSQRVHGEDGIGRTYG